jgi:hypothetical protein
MTDAAQNQLIASIARDLVAQTAPQELPLFQATSEAYFKNPQKLLRSQSGKDEMLGFGVVDTMSVVMASPIILNIVNDVVTVLIGEARDAGFFKRLFGKSRSTDEPTKGPRPLTREMMQQMYQVALEKGRQFQLSEAQAAQLADSLVAKIATTYK